MNDLLKTTKTRLKNHLHYSKWYYIAAIAAALIIVNIAYTVSEPRYPSESRVSIMIYGGNADEDAVTEMENEMLALLPDNQREVVISSSVSVDDLTQAVVMARIAAKEDDIIIMDTENIQAYTAGEAFLPLDEYIDINTIFDLYPDTDWNEYYKKTGDSEEAHIYWLPLNETKWPDSLQIDGENLGIALLVNSENTANAVICVEHIMTMQ